MQHTSTGQQNIYQKLNHWQVTVKLLPGWLSASSSKREALSANHEEEETCLVLNDKDAIQNKCKQMLAMDGVRNVKEEERLSGVHYLGLVTRKPVFGGLRTTQAQTSLRIRAV